jgi:hypothetical protein
MSTRAPVSLVSVYDGQTCIGFLLSRGCRGIEAFDAAERSLGLFSDQRAAADALSAEAEKGES